MKKKWFYFWKSVSEGDVIDMVCAISVSEPSVCRSFYNKEDCDAAALVGRSCEWSCSPVLILTGC